MTAPGRIGVGGILGGILLLLVGAGAATAQSGLVVSEVRFEGNSRYSAQVLEQRIRLRVGQVYDDRLHE